MTKPKVKTAIEPAKSSALTEFESIQGKLSAELDDFETELKPYVVESQEDLQLLADILATSKGHEKKSTTLMKQALEPIKAQEASIKEVFKPIIDRLKSLEVLIKSKVGDYHKQQQHKQFLALEAAARANMGGNAVRAEAALARADRAQVEPIKGMSVRYTIDIEVENEDLVPDEWWCLDEARIGKYARATNGEIPIPGIVYHKTPIVSSKARA